jgi:hypothetical protein
MLHCGHRNKTHPAGPYMTMLQPQVRYLTGFYGLFLALDVAKGRENKSAGWRRQKWSLTRLMSLVPSRRLRDPRQLESLLMYQLGPSHETK